MDSGRARAADEACATDDGLTQGWSWTSHEADDGVSDDLMTQKLMTKTDIEREQLRAVELQKL